VEHREHYPTERMCDASLEEMVQSICAGPGMWVIPPSFTTVCAYIDGFNSARGGGPLLGFREWLVLKLDDGNNFHWIGLADRLIAGDEPSEGWAEERRILALGGLIVDYLRERDRGGITKVYYDYGRWLLRKRWYDGPLRKERGGES
jgi:hypothetical protein